MFLLVLLLSSVFLLLCRRPNLQLLSSVWQLAIQLHSRDHVLLSQALHEGESFFSFLRLDIQANKSDSLFVEQFLEFISVCLSWESSNINLEVIVHRLVVLLLSVLWKLFFLDLLVFQLRKSRNSDDFILQIVLVLNGFHFFQVNFGEIKS